jgi:hypothetical protein
MRTKPRRLTLATFRPPKISAPVGTTAGYHELFQRPIIGAAYMPKARFGSGLWVVGAARFELAAFRPPAERFRV